MLACQSLTLLVAWSQALFFVSASMKSGRAIPLNSFMAGLLHPIFSLQVIVEPLFPDIVTVTDGGMKN
jgi:hypothetical protein